MMQGTDGIEDEQNSRNGQGLKRETKLNECVVDKTLISFALVTTDHKNEGREEKTKRNRVGKISATPGKATH